MTGPAGAGRGPACEWQRHPLRACTGSLLRPGGLALTERGLALCGFFPGARLLDLGCGPGATLGLLHRLGFACLGLDRSSAVLREARPQAPCVQADMARLPLANAVLDGIVCECVLSLAENKAAVLAECRRTLRPGGRLFFSDLTLGDPAPGDPAPGDLGDEDKRRTTGQQLPCLSGALSRAAWRALLKRAGFTILHEEDQTGSLRSLAARIVWEFGSLDALAGLWNAGRACGPPPGMGPATRPGYFLLVAEAAEPA